MKLVPESLNKIGEFVKSNLGAWLREVGPPELRSTEGLRLWMTAILILIGLLALSPLFEKLL